MELRIFKNSAFGNVRVSGTSDEPLFCLADVCKVVGLKNPSSVKARLEPSDTQLLDLHALNPTEGNITGNAKATFITEYGLYDVLLQSDAPQVKPFRKWVTSEVLPTIRKTVKLLQSVEYQGNIDGIAYANNGIVKTTSSIIADVFGKDHKNILRAIDNKIQSKNREVAQFCAANIVEIQRLTSTGVFREFELTEDGFNFIALSLTGDRADEFKIKFLTAFQTMRNAVYSMVQARVLESVLPQDSKLRQYLYVIHNPLTDFVKIGVAQDVDKRLKQLETGAGVSLELVYKSMVCSNAYEIETKAHKHFADNRVFGE